VKSINKFIIPIIFTKDISLHSAVLLGHKVELIYRRCAWHGSKLQSII